MRLKTLLLAACAAAIPFFAPAEAKAGHNRDCHYIAKTVSKNGNVKNFVTKFCYGRGYYNVISPHKTHFRKHKPHFRQRPHFVRHDYMRHDRGYHRGHDRHKQRRHHRRHH